MSLYFRSCPVHVCSSQTALRKSHSCKIFKSCLFTMSQVTQESGTLLQYTLAEHMRAFQLRFYFIVSCTDLSVERLSDWWSGVASRERSGDGSREPRTGEGGVRSVEDKIGEQKGEENPSLRSSFTACSLRDKFYERGKEYCMREIKVSMKSLGTFKCLIKKKEEQSFVMVKGVCTVRFF